MNTYSTTEVARNVGIHPNTVRMYEKWGLIPQAERKSNGRYRHGSFLRGYLFADKIVWAFVNTSLSESLKDKRD